jgi:universal stress protein A
VNSELSGRVHLGETAGMRRNRKDSVGAVRRTSFKTRLFHDSILPPKQPAGGAFFDIQIAGGTRRRRSNECTLNRTGCDAPWRASTYPAVVTLFPVKKVLVAIDSSAAAVPVCEAGAKLASALNARLTLLHAVPRLQANPGYHIPMQSRVYNTLDRAAHKKAARKMKALQHWFAKRWPDTRMVMHDGAAVDVILKTARVSEPDLIVLGSHGHTAAYDLLVGSTAHSVLRRSRWPVVLVPIGPRGRRRGR